MLVATVNTDKYGQATYEFQSLSGFLARCNLIEENITWPPLLIVSIPVGFSCSLQPLINTDGYEIKESFNPCRVFLLVATLIKKEQNK